MDKTRVMDNIDWDVFRNTFLNEFVLLEGSIIGYTRIMKALDKTITKFTSHNLS
jgi:hypothetical protein